MNDICYKTKLFTKYLNRYFRKDGNIQDWSFQYNHDSIDVQVDYIDDYSKKQHHQKQQLSFCELFNIPDKEIEKFSIYFVKGLSRRYEDEVIYEV